MDSLHPIIVQEERRCADIVDQIKDTLAAEAEARQKMSLEIERLKQERLEAEGWREKREIEENIIQVRQHHAGRLQQDAKVLNQPYFGVLEIEDDDLGGRSYCLGRQSFFARRHQVLVIDWREAPISRLYYEYEAGELYEEKIRGRERTGSIRSKRQTDTTGGELRKLVEHGVHWVRQADGSWRHTDSGGAVSRKEGQQDHRLPEITSLISREQFRAITHPDSRTIILQGGAGSGKTTVGLHRIAYLAYQNPERFRSERLLVVMFNRSLQKYISRVLPDLGIKPGVQVETYHSWSGKLFKRLGMNFAYPGSTPEAVTRLKKHPRILSLIENYLSDLLNKSRQWLQERLEAAAEFAWEELAVEIPATSRFSDFLQLLSRERNFSEPKQVELWQGWRARLLTRLNDHKLDLHTLLTHRQLLQTSLATDRHTEDKALDQLIHWQTNLQNDNRIDYADAGLLLYLMQLKGVNAARPRYAHIMVDEAQDLSQVELATLLAAADEQQSLTICGDMAQKIKGEVTFTDAAGFGNFIHRRQADLGLEQVWAETLMVGYRATRPIMELAWQVLGEQASLVVARDGPPVRIIRTPNYEDTLEEAKQLLTAYRRERPQALIAVVCRYIADADRICTDLQRLGLGEVRRHAREDFSFQPGIIVTNAHQVKGLEFTAVMIINPSTQHYRDDRASRMLLHVVITRAADQLWIVGHQPLAYGLEDLIT